jgi:hypothetical protein
MPTKISIKFQAILQPKFVSLWKEIQLLTDKKQVLPFFYILLTVHLDVILVNDQIDALFLNVFVSRLYMFRATSAHHQEDQLLSIHHLV